MSHESKSKRSARHSQPKFAAAGTGVAQPSTPVTQPAAADWVSVGRIPIADVAPVIDAGAYAAKSVPGQDIPVAATVFREGHDRIGAEAVLLSPQGEPIQRVKLRPGANDRFTGTLRSQQEGAHSFYIESFADLYATWKHNARVKIEAGVDEEVMLAEGADLLRKAAQDAGRPPEEQAVLAKAASALSASELGTWDRLAAGVAPEVREIFTASPLKDLRTVSATFPIRVERAAAGQGAWYEFFPRSEGAVRNPDDGKWTSGTFRTATASLNRVADMGFDVIYLPPIHPIGEVNRKGPNNTLIAGPDDPGSPWAIGSKDGGHDAIHPDLGTFADFDAFVERAHALGLEVALDLALQCAPDHPWAKEHPQWFTTRVDGSIAYAENPPKKYQDIYPLNFDNDPAGLSNEVFRIVELWISHGVKIFRVDNPHTKPLWFWQWLIGKVNAVHPEVVFLAEAFTAPAMMHALAKVGFQQSYSYFTWRNYKDEIAEYLTEISSETQAFYRPNFFVNTPDILTEFLQYGGPAGFKIRAALAATSSPLWGMYSGFELFEHVARPGSEEYIDNEKYEYKARDFEAALESGRSLAPYVTKLNSIRRAHPALGDLSNLTVHPTSDPALLAYSKTKQLNDIDGASDTVIVVLNVDPHSARQGMVYLNLDTLGLSDDERNNGFDVFDEISGATWHWGSENFVRLDAYDEPAHILHVRRTV